MTTIDRQAKTYNFVPWPTSDPPILPSFENLNISALVYLDCCFAIGMDNVSRILRRLTSPLVPIPLISLALMAIIAPVNTVAIGYRVCYMVGHSDYVQHIVSLRGIMRVDLWML